MAKVKVFIFLILFFLALGETQACLTFCLKRDKDIIFGRNFDWYVDVGAVFINQRNFTKTSFVLPVGMPLSWKSKYGSVTFNQISRELPVGGMNEKGLVIECMVSEAEYPKPDNRSITNELQWIQYHLDTCRNVDEVMEAAPKICPMAYAVKLHYLLSDASGKTAVMEYLNGKLVIKTGKDLPKKVLANKSYDYAMETLEMKRGRFYHAAQMIDQFKGQKKTVDYAFDILDKISQKDFTVWQVVYDIPKLRIYFRTEKAQENQIC